MNNSKTKQFKVNLPEDTINKLRVFIRNKYPSYNKGPLSIEVNNAILRHLSVEGIQHHTTRMKQGDHIYDLHTLCNQIIEHLIDIGRWSQPLQYIAEKHLREALYVIKGKDPRTVNKWIKRLEQGELIQKCGAHQYRFIYMEND